MKQVFLGDLSPSKTQKTHTSLSLAALSLAYRM